MEAALRSGIFAQSDLGCLTIQPRGEYVIVSYTANSESSAADEEVQTTCLPSSLFDKALEMAGYMVQPQKARARKA